MVLGDALFLLPEVIKPWVSTDWSPGDIMAGSEKYLVWIFPAVMQKLGERHPDVPLKELLEIVRDSLATRAPEGRKAPFPYAAGVQLLTVEELTSEGAFRITPVYEITKMDHAVEVLDIGIIRMVEGG